MIRILIILVLVLTSNVLIALPISQSNSNLIPCFKMNDIERIGKELNELLRKEFCEDRVNPKRFASIGQNALSKIMTAEFLGVTPPENWQPLADDIINNCLKASNLCQREARKEFATCVQVRVPLLLMQFAPWLSDNCSLLNQSLIQRWVQKKIIIKQTIDANKGPLTEVPALNKI